MTRRLVAAAAAFLLVGCGPVVPTPTGLVTPSPSPSMWIDHPTGVTDVVLRMSSGGGLPYYIGPTYTRPPQFTLYGDGRVIYLVVGDQPPLLRQARLSEDQVGALLEYALGEAGLAMARAQYDEPGIYDVGTTRFVINAGGFNKSVAVYALGFYREDGPDQEARHAFEALAEKLDGFGEDVAAGNVVDLGEFTPSAYGVTLDRRFGPEVTGRAPWPWADLQPADFGPVKEMGSADRIVDTEHGAAVLALGIWDALIVTGPDDVIYQIKIRPLLPDELPN
ncbi:MAG: hypothetical protein A2146_01245 [Actinobacteria bacterium RBG_16_67_10]|nr:MAG: hypothetical protein A2146_01245 [Actinobacteria bacterium RBG_16_67_10]